MEKYNALGYEEFVQVFGNVIEYCPVISAAVWGERPFASPHTLHQAICDVIDGFSLPVKEGILRCHPDLAGRLAQSGSLSADSTKEQQSAGLLDATDAEKKVIQENNDKYRAKFGFPFVICVRQNKKRGIMKGMEARLANTREDEVRAGVEEVKKIGLLRIMKIIGDDGSVATKASL